MIYWSSAILTAISMPPKAFHENKGFRGFPRLRLTDLVMESIRYRTKSLPRLTLIGGNVRVAVNHDHRVTCFGVIAKLHRVGGRAVSVGI